MSNHKKGALVLLCLGSVLLVFSTFSKEWRIRFAYIKDAKGAQYEQSERYSPAGMETFYGCKKGCQAEDRKRTVKQFRTWSKLVSLSKEGSDRMEKRGRPSATLKLFSRAAGKTSTLGLIVRVTGWVLIALAMGFFVLGFFKKISLNPLVHLGVLGGVGVVHLIFSVVVSGALKEASKAFYVHATYNPNQVNSTASLGFWAAVGGAALVALAGVLSFLDRGDPLARFAIEAGLDVSPESGNGEHSSPV